jgi:hypothetical protein
MHKRAAIEMQARAAGRARARAPSLAIACRDVVTPQILPLCPAPVSLAARSKRAAAGMALSNASVHLSFGCLPCHSHVAMSFSEHPTTMCWACSGDE